MVPPARMTARARTRRAVPLAAFPSMPTARPFSTRTRSAFSPVKSAAPRASAGGRNERFVLRLASLGQPRWQKPEASQPGAFRRSRPCFQPRASQPRCITPATGPV